MKKTLLIYLILITQFNSYSQFDRYLSFELLGSGGIASFNFEKTFYQKNKLKLNYRIGFSAMPIDKNNGDALIFPLMVHAVLGEKAHKLDVGLGQSITITTKLNGFILMPMSFGYRFEPTDKRYYLRASYTPLISYLVDRQWQHWGGLTYGFKLKQK